ncbi:hypothetical protein [Parafrigoribacterium soli]|uniref:hypothetical protein n=1 Tax=Parafrigoribacterium soli TaxID=3144663 RepID=UPI0032EAB9D0
MRKTRFANVLLCTTAMAALALSGCVADHVPEASPTPTAPQKVAYDATGLKWFPASFDTTGLAESTRDDAPAEGATGPSTDGVEVEPAKDSAGPALDDDVEAVPDGNDELQIQPCSFVGMPAWVRFARDRTAPVTHGSQFEIEPGERCLYLETSDLNRMTVALYKRTGHTAWLDPATAARGVPVESLGAGAVWLPKYPEAYANTLVASKKGADAVITIYSTDKRMTAADIQTQAIEWMKAVLGTTGGR